MTCVEDVTRARNPQEALLAIAKHIDALAEQTVQPAPDPWSAWQPTSEAEFRAPIKDREPESFVPQRDDEAIARVYEQIAATNNPEDLDALNARLRLLQDDGRSIESVVPEGERPLITSVGDNGTVDLPPADHETQKQRYQWAHRCKLDEFIPLGQEEAAQAYAKGGPMWLYLGNRDAVMAMPVEWRREMVEDIHRMSPATAHEVARDILKDEGPGSPEITVEAING